jgi:hypothetical protein
MYDDPDAYAVYKVLLGSPELPGGKVPSGTVAIESQTTGDKICFDPAAETDSRLREAAVDYSVQNSNPRLLGANRLEFGRKVELISLAELDSTFSAGIIPGWKRFHKEHSEVHGYYGLSAVGFSADRSFAVLVTGAYCGPTCGAGGVVTFSKRNGVWHKNSNQLCPWIS